MSELRATHSALLTNAVGLHARPSVKLTKLAKTFESQIEVGLTENGPWVDAKSIVKVMATKARRIRPSIFRAEGKDAKAALDAAPGTSHCTADSSDRACWMPPVPARFLLRRRPILSSLLLRLPTPVAACCSL